MKNKRISLIIVIAILLSSTSNTYAGETYAGRGALIGGITGGVAAGTYGAIVGHIVGVEDGDDQGAEKALMLGFLFGGVGGLVGAGFGALIGAGIKKDPKVTVAPLYIRSDSLGNTTGGSVQFTF